MSLFKSLFQPCFGDVFYTWHLIALLQNTQNSVIYTTRSNVYSTGRTQPATFMPRSQNAKTGYETFVSQFTTKIVLQIVESN